MLGVYGYNNGFRIFFKESYKKGSNNFPVVACKEYTAGRTTVANTKRI